MIIPEQFGFNCPSGFREEAFWNISPIGSNVKLSSAVAAILNFIGTKNVKFVEDQNLSSFWLILKQQWTIKEISIFSNSSHLEWLSDTILKGTHTGTIPARFGLIWFSGFRGEDLIVIFYQNMHNLHNRYKSPEEKFHRKTWNIC
jgi:hypothetical protein